MNRKTVVRTMLVLALLTCAMIALAQVASAAATENSLSVISKASTNELRGGMTGDQVVQYQDRLIHYGYLESSSGVFDDGTIQATRYFQAANKISVSGIATAKTRTLINKDAGVVKFSSYEAAQQTNGFKPNAFGLGVALVQQRLTDLGYYTGKIDGKYASATAKAVVVFKKFNYNHFGNISATVSGADRKRIDSDSMLSYREVYGDDTLKPGDSGEQVEIAQYILSQLNFYKGGITGKYGSEMAAAVKRMQKKNKLYPSGWLFSTSMAILNKDGEKASLIKARTYAILDLALDLAKEGCKYKLGENGPNLFDCSGFTTYVFGKYNISLSHNAAAQSRDNRGKLITKKTSLMPGDLVFFATGKSTTKINHVGIVYSTSGGNVKFVHASSAGGKVMKSAFMDSSKANFYNKRFRCARRMW